MEPGPEGSLQIGQRRDQQIAERMAADVRSVESVVEETAPERVLWSHGKHAAADVAGRRDVESRGKAARATSIVRDSHHGPQRPGIWDDGLQDLREPMAAADTDDVRPGAG